MTIYEILDEYFKSEFHRGKTEQMRAYAASHGIPSVEIKTSGAYPSFQNFVTKWTMKKDDE